MKFLFEVGQIVCIRGCAVGLVRDRLESSGTPNVYESQIIYEPHYTKLGLLIWHGEYDLSSITKLGTIWPYYMEWFESKNAPKEWLNLIDYNRRHINKNLEQGIRNVPSPERGSDV